MKTKILDAAVRLFTQKGYINTSMDDIAEAVGLTKGGLYHHVEKKEDLLTAIHDRMLDTFFFRMDAAVNATTDPMGKLDGWIRAHATIMNDFQPQIKVVFTELDNLSPENFRRMIRNRDLAQKMLRDIIAKGIESGSMRSDVNPNVISFLILGMINWLYLWYRPRGPLSLEEIIRNIRKVVFDGLAKEHEPIEDGRRHEVRPGARPPVADAHPQKS